MAVNYNPRSVTNGLVLHIDPSNPRSYPGNGTTIYDVSGNGNNGTLTNMNVPACYVRTYGGRALDFDGIDDSVPCMRRVGLSVFSVSFWLNSSSVAVSDRLVIGEWSNTVITNRTWIISSEQGAGARMIFGTRANDGNLNLSRSTSNVINVGKWDHYVMVFPGTFNLLMFQNGINVPLTDVAKSSVSVNTAGTNTLIIGSQDATSGTNLLSQIDDVRIYNRALSLAEIRQNYNATRGRFGV